MKILNNINLNNKQIRFAGEKIICKSCGAEILLEKSDKIKTVKDSNFWKFDYGRYVSEFKILQTRQNCSVYYIICPSCEEKIYFVIPTRHTQSCLIDTRRYHFGRSIYNIFDRLYQIHRFTEDFEKNTPKSWNYGEVQSPIERKKIQGIPEIETLIYENSPNIDLKLEYKRLFGIDPPKDSIENLSYSAFDCSYYIFGDTPVGGDILDASNQRPSNCYVWLNNKWILVKHISYIYEGI